jgi:hypothetical protein
MATKANLLSTINGFITAVITQAKHRSSMSTVVDEIYPSNVTDSQTTETYTTKAGTNFSYSIRITKSGNIAHIKGEVRNITNSLQSSQNIFTWKDNEFKPKSGINDFNFKAFTSGGEITLFLSNNVLFMQDVAVAVANTTYRFEFITYITQD